MREKYRDATAVILDISRIRDTGFETIKKYINMLRRGRVQSADCSLSSLSQQNGHGDASI